MLGFLVVALLPAYEGRVYPDAGREFPHVELTDSITRSDSNNARESLEKGAYFHKFSIKKKRYTCRKTYLFFGCCKKYKNRVFQERVVSRYRCKGCPWCSGNSACFIYPCDSWSTAKPHKHIGQDVWFPERVNCPFRELRTTPHIVQEEQSDRVWEDTCSVYEKDRRYICLRSRCVDDGEDFTYAILQDNTCQDLEKKGCQNVRRTCVQEEDGLCRIWEWHYLCDEEVSSVVPMPSFMVQAGSGMKEPPNKKMPQALALLQGAADGARHAQVDAKTIRVFGGSAMRCHVDMAQFRDCCKEMDGWGRWFGCGCSQEERQLARMRHEGRCVYVGKRISDYLVGMDMRTQKLFCCFPNALIKELHTHARAQLGRGWGTASHADCAGLLVEGELEKVDFSDIDEERLKRAFSVHAKGINYEDIKQKVVSSVKRLRSD